MISYKKYWVPLTPFYLIRWKPNGVTPLHNHPNKECNMLVLKGELEENVYKITPTGNYIHRLTILKPHQCSHINDSIGHHVVKNKSNKCSWSLHYYKKIN